ncbi:beta-ketoacyl-ACP synthase II [Micromonospora zamorensis]|jgi:3-oxoacyl-[acyl-carrier-protein] synthase II|uniref:3-oxoacyl-[acyl-carrier-protein] synthase 2 n=1 Tax=Micromonospora zamorensis TaxID=709883 RepID=A0ABZ1PG02_9ACTN|nr:MULTISPECIES: beta-ketoacyl-ACP synthase II [Micromonospora]MBQ0982087.1 beta-ketoacyl-ACP synthase II [Micromonospora sp. M61]MBQ1039879.1 beta-ketoacyl-ACP synthase II [Micromonospora sp. C81]MCG5471482.1 beta-ketoacyl-ACP synthase II [Micromonospora cabrerizensis]TQJ24375.1 3-oxoacyl-[acyl-carrier-protein] synthase II [Micromonospora sp. A202]WSK50456.1 beta-ketoacyl-ACP synthase II [Micromonospora zamorensis]
MSRPDVVVTGLGATTPLGGDVASTWDAMLAGRSGVSALTQEWAAQLPVRIAAQLAVEPSEVLDRVRLRRLDRSEAIAIIAAQQAWADAGLAGSDLDGERLAVSVGSGIGGATTLLAQDDILEASGPRRVSPHTIPMLMPNGPAAWVGLELGAKAGVHSVASACATGAEAIALGLDIIRAGRADVVVAGGTEAVIHPLPIAGFSSMRAMSTRNDDPERASRPWDRGRDGFVLGEGAGIVVLERAEHAAARGARVYARLAGAGITSDAYDIVQPHAEGEGAIRAIAKAIADADVAKRDIVHVNAHATSTPVGDMLEISGLHKALGDHPVLSATKSMTGHLLGAAGALESIATILAIRDSVVPPTINLDDPEPGLTLDVAAHKARHMEIPAALNNAFGFGGHNVALVFARP